MAKTIDELYKQYQSGQKAGANAPASTAPSQKKADTSGFDQLYQRWRQQDYEKNRAQYESSVQQRLDDLYSRQSSFSDAYTSRHQNRNESTYYGDYEDWYQRVSQERDSYFADVDAFMEEFAKYEEFYDQDYVDSVRSSLYSGKQGYAQALAGAQDDRNYYSSFKTEEDFQSYIAQMQEQEDKKNLNLDDAQKEIDALKEELNTLKVTNTVPQNNYLTGNSTATSTPYAAGQQAQMKATPTEARIDELERMISQKEAYMRSAQYIQNGVALAGAVTNTDFNQYNDYVSTKSDDFTAELTSQYGLAYEDLTYEYINNQNGLRDEIKNKHKLYTGDGTESYYEAQGYDYLTEDEIAIYNYYYAKEGKEKAEEYLSSIQESLNQRKATGIFEPMEDQTLMELAFGVAAGLDQFESGIQNALNFKDDYIPVSATQYASGMVREDLEDAGAKLPEWMGGGSLGQMGYDAITTTANMAPSILSSVAVGMLNPVAGQVVGNALMGGSAAGNAYQQALNEGYSKAQARSYGTLVGASEIVMEKVLGGISALGGNSPLGKLITGNVANADTALKMIAKRIGGSMISEFSEEYLQEVLTPVFENMILRTDNEVKLFSAEALYSGILGALTAGVMEGPGVIVNEVRTNQTGKELLAEGIDTQKLAEVGSKFAADTVAYQLAGKVDENTGAYTIGRLFNEIGATLTEQNQNQITEALVQEGMPNVYAKKHAEILAYIVEGGEVSDIQMKMIESNPMVSKVMKEVIIDSNSTVYQRTMGYNEVLMQLAHEKAGANASRINPGEQGEANVSSKGNLTTEVKTPKESNYEASEDGKAILDGKEVTLDGLRKMADGTIMVATADNLTADPSEVTYPTKGTALVYESYANLESITEDNVIRSMPVEARSALAKSYDPAAGIPANVWVQGSNHAYWYGFEGISMNEKTVPSNSPILYVGEAQRKLAYDLGRKAAEKGATTQKAGIKAAYEAAVEEMGGEIAAKAVARKNKGTVILDSNIDKATMTRQQRASYKLARKVAEKLGINIRIYSGMKEYGKYDMTTGELSLNINAMIKLNSMMTFTLSHELVHMAKQWSPDEFKAFADYLLDKFGEKGYSVEDLIQAQMKEAQSNGMPIDRHVAYEEVIASACEKMLLDSDALAKMYGYKVKNPGNWQKIVDAITKFIDTIRQAFKGVNTDSVEAELYESLDDVAKNFLVDKFVDMVMDAGKYQATIQNAFGKGTVVEVNENGEFTLAKGEDSNGATKFLYNAFTWETGGRETLSAALKTEGFSDEDIKAALTIVDGKHKLVKELAKKFPEQNRINEVEITTDLKNGHSVLSALVSNGDYPVNIDLLMVCKKRKAYQRVINRLCETGLIQQATVDALAIAEINKILGKYGFETACLGCFVESRRLRIQEWGNTIVKEWNAEVKKRNPNAKPFGFGKGEATLTPDEVMQLIGELESGGPKNDQGNLNLGQGSAVKRMGVLLDKVPSLRKTLSIEDLITPDGLTALRKFDSNLFSMVKSRYGSNSPKFVQEFNPYKHELAIYGKVPTEYKSLREYLYAIGGARMQSFSDFIVENWFDYCQIVADLAARKLPMHTYTKEIALVKLFGLTGIKINMSLIPDIDRSLGKEYAGLTRNANGELELIWADKDRFKKTGGKSYMQSINFADAIALQEDPRYSANVGTIAVGVSDNHILMMLDDPRIRMVIPYHSSGMNPIFADLMGTSYYKDYTNFQNTTVKQVYNSKGQKVSLKLDKTQTGKLTSGFQFNEVLQDLGDARAAAQAYKDWCADASKHTITIKGETYTAELTPKFDDFSGHENYYKLLEDFNTYDCISEQTAPQGDVQQIYPEDFDKILTDELKSQEGQRQKQVKNQAFDKAMGEIESYLKNHTKADTVFYAEQHGVKLGAKDKKLSAEDKKKLADLRKGTRFKMPKAKDTEYLDAVNRGDMETAQKLVDEAAKSAGFSTEHLYHGTSFFGFTTIDTSESDDSISFFATTNQEVAQGYMPWYEDDASDRYHEEPRRIGKDRKNRAITNSSSVETVIKTLNHAFDNQYKNARAATDKETLDSFKLYQIPEMVDAAEELIKRNVPKKIEDLCRLVVEANKKDTFAAWADVSKRYKEFETAEIPYDPDDWSKDILWSRVVVDLQSISKMARTDPIWNDGAVIMKSALVDRYNTYLGGESIGMYDFYGKNDNQMVVWGEGSNWKSIPLGEHDAAFRKWLADTRGNVAPEGRTVRASTRDISEFAKHMGYRSVVFVDIYDAGAYGERGVLSDVYSFFYPQEDIKSADPVTYDDSGNVIPLSERFNPKNKDIRYKMPKTGKSKPSNPKDRTFSYQELIAKGKIVGEVIKSSDYVRMKAGLLDEDWLVNRVIRDCKKIQTGSNKPTYYAEVPDIGRNVQVTSKGILHGGGNYKKNERGVLPPAAVINNKITVNLVNILRTAIEVNRSTRGSNIDVPFTHIMLGVAGLENADGSIEYYGVRIEIEERVNRDPILAEVKVLGRLYAVNAKKISSPHAQVIGGADVALATGSFSYSVADLLNDVKKNFDDTFSLDVYRKLKMSRKGSPFSANLLYKSPNSRGVSSRELLADAFDELVQTPKERELMDQYRANITKAEEVQERLRKVRGEISKLTKAKGDKARINKLNKTAAELADLIDMYDRKLLELEASKPLRDVLARAKTAAQKEAKQRSEQLMKEYRQQVSERFDRGIEGRRKTEMRKKIRKVIRDLDKILYRGDKKRNVKEDMKDFVAEALSAAEVLFTDNYSNEDILRNGFGVELSEDEAKYAAEAQKILEDLSNLPSGSYDAAMARQEAEATLKNKLSYRMSKLKDAFYRERQMLNKTEVATVLGNLADAYAKLETSEYAYVNGAYHEAVYQYLKMLQEDVGGSKVKDMTLGQLEELYKAYTMVLTTVRNANTMFAQDLKQSKEELANRVMMEVYQAGGEHGLWSKGELARNQASWNNTKPIYAAERTGSPTFVKLVNGLFKGQYAWAVDMAEAKAYRQKVADKYGFKKWDMEKLYKFTSSSGIDFELNLNQIMSLYAYAKREQAHEHLLKGGFVFGKNTEVVVTKNGIKRTYLNKSAKAHNISDEIMGEIISKLSAEQKGFVDEMQDYLSTTMGAKGNEVSMRIYGVKLFLEKFYFPLRSAGQFKEKAKEAELKQQQGQISIVNAGFTKAVTPKASNPVVLDGFMDVWAGHVNEMSLYHSMVLPMEDFRRVYNYASPNMEGEESASVNSFIENAYGDAATGYFDQLYKELNGGAIVDPRENLSKQMIGKFKKSAVMLSNSVWVQQFSAIGRAYALINPKYFIGAKVDKKRHALLWEEMKKYAPVTIIKEMGGFDTHTGASANDFLLAEDYGKGERVEGFLKDEKYRSEIMGWAPAKADQMTWAAIWEAVKREVNDKHPKMDVKSEEFLKMVGERFSEVIERTQVYDSVLARSANMRSKQGLMQMVTAFMAEPTTTVNMIEDALRKGNKAVIARTFGAVAASIILNNALASIVYAMRDDDEDETFLEKYAQAVTSGMLDDLNPLTYYPILKDIWSLFQGYDIERSDMAIYSDIVDAVKKTASIIAKYDSDMDEEEAAEYYRNAASALMSLLDAGAAAFGVPLKNVRRDLMSYFNTVKTFASGNSTTWNSFKDAVGGATLDNIPLVGLFAGKSKQDKLYNAIVSGDTAYVNRLKNGYSSESAYNTALRKALRENDPRIHEAAVARYSGDLDEYMRIAREIIAEGHFIQDDVVAAINTEINALEKGETTTTTTQKASGLFKAEDFATAIAQGDSAMANAVKVDIIQTSEKNGKTAEEAEQAFKSSAKTEMKELFLAGEITEDQAVSAMTDYLGIDLEDAEADVGEWAFEADYGFRYSDRGDAYKSGAISATELQNIIVTVGGKTEEEAALQVEVYNWQMEGFDIESNQMSIVEDYETFCEPAGIDKNTYFNAYLFYDESGEEGVAYSKTIECMPYINSLPLTASQKTALAMCWWAESTVNKYKLW